MVLFNPGEATVLVLPRGDLSGTPAEVTLSGEWQRRPGADERRFAAGLQGAVRAGADAFDAVHETRHRLERVQRTSPGDLTGDGRADLPARKASTGDVYLFAAKSDGTLAAGKRIRSAWTGHTKIVGAGDLNGDGIGDVLARDGAGTLWCYNGPGNGQLKDRVKVSAGWGVTYDAVVGVGDLTGDGKNDLVARDTSGNPYRYDGKGNGSFGARVKIATGWQGYKGLF